MINLLPETACPVKFSVLIPVYNSEKSLPLVLDGVREVFRKLNHSYEFVLVDDGSGDDSWKIIQQQHQNGDLCAIRFLSNKGHSVAMKRGLEFCQGEWTITMDDDLQHPPSELPKLIDAAINDPDIDVVMGAYGASRGMVHKTLGSRLYQFVLKKSFSIPPDLVMTSFRVIHRRIVNELIARNLSSPHAAFMILSSTKRIKNVEVERHDRAYGESGMTLKKSVTTLLDSLVLNSEWPLKVIGLGGLALSVSAAGLACYYMLKYLVGDIGVSGFTTSVLLITGFSGIILASISVVGLYIMRLIQQATFTPSYSLRNHLPRPASKDSHI